MKDHDLLLSVEGIDRTGKTEIVRALEDALHGRSLQVYTVHDPPRLDPWEDIQREFLDRETDMSRVSVAFLFLAARLDGVQREIIPALSEETFVIADRYVDSWVAYHAHRLAGMLGTLDDAIDFLVEVHRQLSDAGLLPFPRRTWLIRDDPEEALRRHGAGESQWENLETQRRVAEVYEKLAQRESGRFRVVDARGTDLDEVRERIVSEVLDYCARAADRF